MMVWMVLLLFMQLLVFIVLLVYVLVFLGFACLVVLLYLQNHMVFVYFLVFDGFKDICVVYMPVDTCVVLMVFLLLKFLIDYIVLLLYLLFSLCYPVRNPLFDWFIRYSFGVAACFSF